MENYYRNYHILKSYLDRGKSAIIKAEKNNANIKLNLSYQGKEIRDNLYLLGFSNTNETIFKLKIQEVFSIDAFDFDKADYLAIILEKQNACSLEYLEKQNEKEILCAFEQYRFHRYSNIKSNRNISRMETYKVFEKSSAKEIIEPKHSTLEKSIVNEKESQIKATLRQEANYEKRNKSKNDKELKSDSETNEDNKQNSGDSINKMMSNFKQASQLFSTMNNLNSNEVKPDTQDKFNPKHEHINPFIDFFPNSEWIKTQYQGQRGYWHYLSGKIYDGQKLKYKAIAVPGEYAISPPTWLEGFNKYYVSGISTANGYWIMFLDPETGKTVDLPE